MPAEEMAHEDAIRATGASFGHLAEKLDHYDVPSVELRFVLRKQPMRPGTSDSDINQVLTLRILQQLWVIYHHPPGDPLHHHRRETEWRDVPLVEE